MPWPGIVLLVGLRTGMEVDCPLFRRIVFFIVMLLLLFVLNGLISSARVSVTATGTVISKDVNPYRITIQTESESKTPAKEAEIIVKDSNLWNLIEENKSYFVTYSGRKNKPPVLRHIEISGTDGTREK